MSLLYPLNKSRTSLSSSSEHRPASKAIIVINENDWSPESKWWTKLWIAWKKSYKIKNSHAVFISLSHTLLLPFSHHVMKFTHPSIPAVFLKRASFFSSFSSSPRKRHTYRRTKSPISGITARDASRNTFWAGSLWAWLWSHPNAPRAQSTAATAVDTDRYRSADAGQ